MRTIGFRSNILFIIAAAVGLIASLDRPWYASAFAVSPEEARIGDVQGPVEGFFTRLSREFTATDGTAGWQAFTTTDSLLTGLVVLAVLTAMGSLVPALQRPARELLRLAAFALLGVVVVKLVNVPDGLVERRQGAWIALGVTGIIAASAAHICNAPMMRRRVGPSLVESPYQPAPPPVADTPGSGGLPGGF